VVAGDGPERGAIERKIVELNLESNVHLLGTVSDIPSVLSMLDLFALTSDNEASPVSIIEAMSCELPVVAPNVGSISELVCNDATGTVVNAVDESEAARAWLQILQDRELGARWGKAARDRAVAAASLTAMTNGYANLIHEILAKKKPRSAVAEQRHFRPERPIIQDGAVQLISVRRKSGIPKSSCHQKN
jgi:glycosyltransferase involved in cell wall biosynthesis